LLENLAGDIVASVSLWPNLATPNMKSYAQLLFFAGDSCWHNLFLVVAKHWRSKTHQHWFSYNFLRLAQYHIWFYQYFFWYYKFAIYVS
jgi:hypothetical protein